MSLGFRNIPRNACDGRAARIGSDLKVPRGLITNRGTSGRGLIRALLHLLQERRKRICILSQPTRLYRVGAIADTFTP